MPKFTFEFEVFCATCGEGLCMISETRYSRKRLMPQVCVQPCPNCIQRAKDHGFDKGFSECQSGERFDTPPKYDE